MSKSSGKNSIYCDFRDAIRNFVGKNGKGIEIGPLDSSIVPKRNGYDVFIIDCASQAELHKRYLSDRNVNVNDIEVVDAIDDGRDFSELLSIPHHSLQYVISSHNIEHLPDPIRFILRCEQILDPSGKLFLIIPDKRGTFDYFRPYSTTGQVLEAYYMQRRKHTLSALFDAAYSTVGNSDSGSLLLEQSLQYGHSRLHRGIESYINPYIYVDAHAWIFTLSSFLLLIHDLKELGIIHLGIEKYYNRQNNEFFVIMGSDKYALSFSRQELLERIVSENTNLNRKSALSSDKTY